MNVRFALALCASLAVLAGCGGEEKKTDEPAKSSSGTTAGGKTLCERLGGYESIKKVTKDFVENHVAKDDRINKFFAKTDLAHLEEMVSQQLGETCGCPGVKYTGRDMKTTHKGMGVGEKDWDAFVEDFKKCLDKNGVAAADRDELVGKLATMKGDIVEKS